LGEIVTLNQPGLEPPPPRPEPPLDRWGRYKIPDPVTGKERGWTRATTWAKSIADAHDLMNWHLRRAALGFSQRRELTVAVAAILDPESDEGKRQLDRLISRAEDVSGANERNTLGTALHSFCEAVDTGRKIQVPAPFDADIADYKRLTRTLKISRNYVERICLIRELGVAGTMDRVVKFHHAELPLIADIKTGKDLRRQWPEIAIQLALYAHADTIWDVEVEHHRPMLKVDQEKALVIHLPAGEGRGQLHIVDIKAGWEMALECNKIRAWRTRRDLNELIVDWSK
jgi:hypothetical protein